MARRDFRSGASLRRRTAWTFGLAGTVSLSAAGAAVFGSGTQNLEDGETAIRIRGELNVALTTSTSSLDGFSECAAGLCVVTENAAGVGVTAVPSPITDIAWDGWMWFWTGSMWSPIGTETGASGTDSARIVIDSKAMRKWKNTDVIVGVFAVTSEVGTFVVQAVMNTRVLFKLP